MLYQCSITTFDASKQTSINPTQYPSKAFISSTLTPNDDASTPTFEPSKSMVFMCSTVTANDTSTKTKSLSELHYYTEFVIGMIILSLVITVFVVLIVIKLRKSKRNYIQSKTNEMMFYNYVRYAPSKPSTPLAYNDDDDDDELCFSCFSEE